MDVNEVDNVKESYKERQESELLVLYSMYPDDSVNDLRSAPVENRWIPLNVKIKLKPQHDSRIPHLNYTRIILHVICPKNYPKVTPKIYLEDPQGLSNADVSILLSQLNKKAYSLRGEVMIFDLCQFVEYFLCERNQPPTVSFYDMMVEDKKKRDQQERTQLKEKEDKRKQQLQHEVLKRKEQLKMQNRTRKTTVNDSPMRSESSNSELKIFNEICDEHKGTENLYFPSEGRKILKGACIGHSLKGCINYSGIDLSTGKLCYLSEFMIGNSIFDTKKLNSDDIIGTIEKKVSVLLKLRHKNLIAYEDVLCSRKKDGYIVVTLVQEFLFGISVYNMSSLWGWSTESISLIAKSVLEALVYLHNNGVTHGNLIDSSIFIDSSGSIKVSDYCIVPYLQDLLTGIPPSVDLLSLASLIESLIPTPSLEMKNFINECNSERTLSASDLLDHPFLYTALGNHDNSTNDQKLVLSCPPPVERATTNINLPTISIAPLISSQHSRLDTEFDFISYIGKGAYGDVLKVRNLLDNRHYAIKRIPLSMKNKQLFRKMTREVELLSRLNHENVVRYFTSWMETPKDNIPELNDSEDEDCSKIDRMSKTPSFNQLALINTSSGDYENDNDSLGLGWNDFIDSSSSDTDYDEIVEFVDSRGKPVQYSKEEDETSDTEVENGKGDGVLVKRNTVLYIQMEFCEKSTLRSAIDSNLYTDKDRYWKLFREIVEGLCHIHQQGMIHRDLKCENIFLDSKDHVKIGDFGLATTNILALQHQNFDANQTLKVLSQSNYGDSHTGLVGTALYCAPELTGKASKSTYNQKVDLYSLGIIFFEMCTPPLKTGMERIQTIAQLRLPAINFPKNMTQEEYKNEILLLKWLLDHTPNKRPTSEELLQSELMPPPKLEASELQEMIRHLLLNPQSRSYKHLISRIIQQESDALIQLTYHLNTIQISPIFENVKSKIEEIFRKHGALDIQSPLLNPYTKSDSSDMVVKLMTHSGSIVTLPANLRSLFLRYIAVNGIQLLRRYSIGRVYREKKVFNFHPKQSYECEFDIVTPTRGNLLVDSEILLTASEIVNEFEVLKEKNLTFKINHTSILHAILLYFSVPPAKYKKLLSIINDFLEEKSPKYLLQGVISSLLPALKAPSINGLIDALFIETPISQINQTSLKSIIKGRGEAEQLAKIAIRELETVISSAQAMGVTLPIILCPGLSLGFDCTRSGSIIWRMCGEMKRGKLVIYAYGGRYDHQLEDSQKLSQRAGTAFVNREMYCAGFSLAIDRLVQSLSQSSDTKSYRSVADLVIFVVGSRPPIAEVCQVLKSLWALGIKTSFIESQDEISQDEIARDLGANHILILGEDGCLRIKSWQNERYDERSVSRVEAIEYLKRNLILDLSGTSLEQSLIIRNSSVANITNESSSSSLPSYEVIFILNEKLNSNKKRRLENQIEQKLKNVLQKFYKKESFVIFATELEAKHIRILLSYIDPNPEEKHDSDFEAIIKGFPKNKQKYVQNIYDEIMEKITDNKNSTVGLFGIHDSYYRLIL